MKNEVSCWDGWHTGVAAYGGREGVPSSPSSSVDKSSVAMLTAALKASNCAKSSTCGSATNVLATLTHTHDPSHNRTRTTARAHRRIDQPTPTAHAQPHTHTEGRGTWGWSWRTWTSLRRKARKEERPSASPAGAQTMRVSSRRAKGQSRRPTTTWSAHRLVSSITRASSAEGVASSTSAAADCPDPVSMSCPPSPSS
jgi:hypothetical protein